MAKIYDLSVQNQTTTERRVIKVGSGKEYDVSFRPAILNRKYFKRWTDFQAQILQGLAKFVTLQKKVENETMLSKEELDSVFDFKALANDAAESGTALIIYAMHANGYTEFTEDELYENFSEGEIAYAIDYIMGIEAKEEIKKKVPRRKKR